MLHKIELPDCAEDLRWIVGIQRTLLEAVCHPDTAAEDVTVERVKGWIAAYITNEAWIESFCKRLDRVNKQPRAMLSHLQEIASFTDVQKQQLLDAFRQDHRLLDNFGDGAGQKLLGIPDGFLKSARMKDSIRGFLEAFYDPLFYKDAGYLIKTADADVIREFHKDEYLKHYKTTNRNVRVCPYCDGQLGNPPQIDHFYPKSDYPQLSCHPLNLVPICAACNSRTNKGTKTPLDLNAPDQTASWFHPFLRSSNRRFSIRFNSSDSTPTHVALHGQDVLDQQRIDNWCKLVNLQTRWQDEFERKVQAAQGKLRKYFLRARVRPTPTAVCDKLQEWSESAGDEIGLEPFALLEQAYYQVAATQEPTLFKELWEYTEDLA